MKPTEKFTDMALIYSKFRPNYPIKLIEFLQLNNNLTEESTIADIGAGTGILSQQLLEKGFNVIAVEPNDDMRNRAEQSLKMDDHFLSIKGTAEDTKIKDHSIDLVTAAQSFHWFDQEKFKIECKRIVKRDAKIALIWNSKDLTSPINIELKKIFEKLCPNFKGFSGGIEDSPNRFEHFFKDGVYDLQIFQNNFALNLDEFIGRSLSSSYAPKQTDKAYDQFIDAVSNLFEKYSKNGTIFLPNITKIYLGNV